MEVAIDRDALDDSIVSSYSNKTVRFRYRSRDLDLPLSHALFSSADIDTGTRFLLKAVSDRLDELQSAGMPLPSRVLDAGCGTGVVALALAAALQEAGVRELSVRAQDRDELARSFTASAARKNGLGSLLVARCEPLLSREGDEVFDLIVSNLPAKAGPAVLRDYFRRSSRMLSGDGFCAVVIVKTLASDARAWLEDSGAAAVLEIKEKEHAVFLYGPSAGTTVPGPVDPFAPLSPYLRTRGQFELLGAEYGLEAIHGASGYDERGREATVAARLVEKIGLETLLGRAAPRRALVFENDQGHFPTWLARAAVQRSLRPPDFTLVGRNILSLAASTHNVCSACGKDPLEAVLAVDFGYIPATLEGKNTAYELAVVFPEIVPLHEWAGNCWSAAAALLRSGGLFLLAASSSDCERFDRVKQGPFERLGDLKRDGFRAMAYRRLG